MAFDVETAILVAGGEGVPLKPIELEGLQVAPSVATPNSQVTGAGDTVLVARHLGGRARVFGYVRDFPTQEVTVIDEANYLTSGQAVWFAGVVIQHRNAGAVSILWVPGTVAAFASVAKPTFAEVKAFLDLDEKEATLGFIGDIRFHRVSDVVIDVATSPTRRPAYTDDNKKTAYTADAADKSTLVLQERGSIDMGADLTSLFGLGAAALAVDAMALPNYAYGGKITGWEFIPGEDGVGGGGDITLQLRLTAIAITDSDLQILLAGTQLGVAPTAATPSALFDFGIADTLDLFVLLADTAFTSGWGTLRVFISEYVAQ